MTEMEIVEETAKNYGNITGYITFGPKDNSLCSAEICYVPTEEQIKNLKEFFGWDYLPKGE